MNKVLRVEVNPISLLATVFFDSVDENAVVEFRLALRSRGNLVESTENGLTMPFHDLKLVLRDLLRICRTFGIVFQSDKYASKLIQSFGEDLQFFQKREPFQKLSAFEIQTSLNSGGFERTLTNFQLRDVAQLLEMRHGANFSVPGAGKTTSLLAIFSVLKSFGLVNRLFVVSPINAFISWEEEIEDIFKGRLRCARLSIDDLRSFSGKLSGNSEVLLVNYEKLRRNIEPLFTFFQTNRVHFVLDESHRIKGGLNNLSFSEIIKLADLAMRRDILTGTPMPQTCFDLEPQYEFLWSQKLLPDYLSENSDALVELANNAIAGRFTRTTKSELGLPNPAFHHHKVQMGPIQSELYNLIRSEAARKLAGLDQNSRSLLRGFQKSVVRLMQAATNPMLLVADETEDEDVDRSTMSRVAEMISEYAKLERPSKMEFLRHRVSTIVSSDSDSKILIWTYFVRNIWVLASILKEYKPLEIYGAVQTGSEQDETTREGILRKFKTDPSCRILLANPQTCGEGISLHKICHNAIYLERNFNAAHFLQSVDRIHRIGLPSGVQTNIEIISAEDTIDEIIDIRLRKKATAMGSVLNDHQLARLAYDPSDFNDEDQDGLDAKDIEAISSHLKNNAIS